MKLLHFAGEILIVMVMVMGGIYASYNSLYLNRCPPDANLE